MPAGKDKTFDDDDQVRHHRSDRDQHAEHRKHLQRHQRKSGDQIEIQADELVERIFRLAGHTLGVLDFDLDRIVCIGIGKGGNVGADLARRGDRAHDVTAVCTQHAALIGHRDAGDALANAVHRFRCDATPP